MKRTRTGTLLIFLGLMVHTLYAQTFENRITVHDASRNHLPGGNNGVQQALGDRQETESAATLVTCAVLTTSTPVGRGEPNERIIGVRITVPAGSGNVTLTKIHFSLEGTSELSDLTALRIWFTGTSPKLVPVRLFGEVPVQQGSITMTGSEILSPGDNYFWVAADLSPDAREGDFLKGTIDSLKIEGQNYPLNPNSSEDQRLIILTHKLLFSGGDDGVVNYRIPAIKTAKDGSLVVAADARVDVPGDLPNNIDIKIRRSSNMGSDWSPPVTIADFGSFGASDPALVVDRNSGDILCMFASHRGLFQSTPGDPIRFQVCRSSDHGISWTPLQECTSQIYAPGWYAAWLASGSAHQQRNGRIIGAVGVRQTAANTISNFMIYSDDAGQTWNEKPVRASATGDEAKIVELDNGQLMMNIRNQTPDCRKIVVSADGGDSWGTPYYQYELTDPAVNGDLIRYTSVLDGFNKSRLLFSIAAHPTIRKNLTIFLSYDEGGSWPVSKVLHPGLSAYSCLTVLNDGTIGCFYENGEYELYQLYFARFSLDWLTDGTDVYTFPVGGEKNREQNFRIRIHPNPGTGKAILEYDLPVSGELTVSITDLPGNEVSGWRAQCHSGLQRQHFDASRLDPGVYLVQSKFRGYAQVMKMVITR